ncbi:hypothetical protein ABIA00_006144 [Bradyrhizobium ottawaense]|uniref:hypothetical protein n=1 Tax=Bradyrhizobium ottawaense TaxID=931866 RepID=UPI003838E68A
MAAAHQVLLVLQADNALRPDMGFGFDQFVITSGTVRIAVGNLDVVGKVSATRTSSVVCAAWLSPDPIRAKDRRA